MKVRFLILAAVVFIVGCSLFSSPQGTAKKFMAAAQKGNADTMTQLFSNRAIQRLGIETIKENNQKFAELSKKANESGSYTLNKLTESQQGNNARVALTYQNKDRTDSTRLVFALSKEGGSWKIDNIGGPELENITDLASAELKDGQKLEPTVTAPAISVPDAPPAAPNPHAPISGGVLNSKATSLPQPPYPPIARSVKAAGTVVVQVTVDENGNVTSAQAISGHPLLQAVSVAAARSAKFEPTKLSGMPVKVNGIINYTFQPPAK